MAPIFLGDVGMPARGTAIVSAAALIAREGVDLHKGMNFRLPGQGDRGSLLSVFLVLERHGRAGEDGFKDEWDAEKDIYAYEGHDSVTNANGKLVDQVAMYESGKLSDNGKFLKAAQEYKDGVCTEPLQVQVYEKLDAGVWFDKGIFNLVDAAQIAEGGRNVFKFYLRPLRGEQSTEDFNERMISAVTKQQMWQRDHGRCTECGSEADLHFVGGDSKSIHLACAAHSGREKRGLL